MPGTKKGFNKTDGRKDGYGNTLPTRIYYKNGSYHHVTKGKVWKKIGDNFSDVEKVIAKNHDIILDGLNFPESWIDTTIRSIRSSPKTRNIDFQLTKEDIRAMIYRSKGRCEITDIKFDFEKHKTFKRRPWTPSVDRIDSTKGYILENCRLICCAANIALNEWGEDILLKIARALIKNNDKS